MASGEKGYSLANNIVLNCNGYLEVLISGDPEPLRRVEEMMGEHDVQRSLVLGYHQPGMAKETFNITISPCKHTPCLVSA